MNRLAFTMAKIAGLQKTIRTLLQDPRGRYFDPATVVEYFNAYNREAAMLKMEFPDLFGDLPDRPVPESSRTADFQGRGYIERHHLERVVRDIDYIFEVRSHSELGVPRQFPKYERRVFISHGPAEDWREVQAFI